MRSFDAEDGYLLPRATLLTFADDARSKSDKVNSAEYKGKYNNRIGRLILHREECISENYYYTVS